jgi:hypothetical protein
MTVGKSSIAVDVEHDHTFTIGGHTFGLMDGQITESSLAPVPFCNLHVGLSRPVEIPVTAWQAWGILALALVLLVAAVVAVNSRRVPTAGPADSN